MSSKKMVKWSIFINPNFVIQVMKVTARGDLRCPSEEHSRGYECDLSLRLGPSQPNQPPDVAYFDNSKGLNESENLDVMARMKKRKAVVSNLYEDLQFCWQPKVSSGNSNGGSLTNGGL